MPPPKSEKERTKAQQGLQEIKRELKWSRKNIKPVFFEVFIHFDYRLIASIEINISPLELLLLKSDSVVAC